MTYYERKRRERKFTRVFATAFTCASVFNALALWVSWPSLDAAYNNGSPLAASLAATVIAWGAIACAVVALMLWQDAS